MLEIRSSAPHHHTHTHIHTKNSYHLIIIERLVDHLHTFLLIVISTLHPCYTCNRRILAPKCGFHGSNLQRVNEIMTGKQCFFPPHILHRSTGYTHIASVRKHVGLRAFNDDDADDPFKEGQVSANGSTTDSSILTTKRLID